MGMVFPYGTSSTGAGSDVLAGVLAATSSNTKSPAANHEMADTLVGRGVSWPLYGRVHRFASMSGLLKEPEIVKNG